MKIRAFLLAVLAWLAFAPVALAQDVDLITLPAAEAVSIADSPDRLLVMGDADFDTAYAGRGRLIMRGGGGAPPPTTQTAYFGPKTLGLHGGAPLVGLVAPATAADTANYTWDATRSYAAPKGTYGATRALLSGCEVMTVTDAAATVFTFNLCADAARAGDYTVRWRDGDTVNSTSGTFQPFKARSVAAYGEVIAWRGGTSFNTTSNCVGSACTGGSNLNGTTIAGVVCNTGATCTNTATFNGSNYIVMRPEVGGTVTVGPISFSGRAWTGIHFTGFTMDGEASTFTTQPMLGWAGSTSDGYPQSFKMDNLTFVGNATSLYGESRPDVAISICENCKGDISIQNVNIAWTNNGIVRLWSTGTSSDIFPGSTAPNEGTTTIRNVEMRNVAGDNVYLQCPRYLTMENNLFTDFKVAITVDNSLNPFSSSQPHSDGIQFNMQQAQTNVCAWQFYPEVYVNYNDILRGLGHDTLPFWTAPPYPNPNNTGASSSAPSQAWVPDPNVAGASKQGIAMTNGAAWSVGSPKTNGGVQRNYEATLLNPQFNYNTVFVEYSGAFIIQAIDGGSVVGNTIVNPRVAGSPNLETWTGFGNPRITIFSTYGTPTIARNISATGAAINGVTPPTSEVVILATSALATGFQAPASTLSPRTWADMNPAYRPIDDGIFEISPGLFAGRLCPNGADASLTSGVC